MAISYQYNVLSSQGNKRFYEHFVNNYFRLIVVLNAVDNKA